MCRPFDDDDIWRRPFTFLISLFILYVYITIIIQPWGWQSREFLRKLAVGYPVTFKVDYTVPAINREFGTIMLNGESIARTVVSEGWARVRTPHQVCIYVCSTSIWV